ncbi:hypothetical protein Btru_046795 [Bulinus truncatus]|nr:hypothetical protein Btru_046795 [Bulinus truncatus]
MVGCYWPYGVALRSNYKALKNRNKYIAMLHETLFDVDSVLKTCSVAVLTLVVVWLLRSLYQAVVTFRYFNALPGEKNFSLWYGNLHMVAAPQLACCRDAALTDKQQQQTNSIETDVHRQPIISEGLE